ncbi:glycosyltransferase [Methylobacterium sp. J-088]|uniref:glycosyltransferase n=1 Tax=Methylobacterium sp. J-088 TaxID=2836664 RepID=UPI001FB99D98|nr:glycosyltransferase [Methylobacterium sp. J-088]MCJ2066314.1 glycosyltransferase [Methylobacterium sp. J-088]
MTISAFVVSYNRESTIEACLRSLRFADELIVIDKGSNDKTFEISHDIADKVYRVEWSPTVERTRLEALALREHENIVFLDDDECFSIDAVNFFKDEDRNGFSDGYYIPCRHFILGWHSTTSYYWPERSLRAFKKGCVQFSENVHSGIQYHGSVTSFPHYESGIYFSNLSHVNAGQWIEKTNRYTSQIERATFFFDDGERPFYDQMRDRLYYWMVERTSSRKEYDQIVAALRAIYDLIDFIKCWEIKIDPDGEKSFDDFCRIIIENHKDNLRLYGKASR